MRYFDLFKSSARLRIDAVETTNGIKERGGRID